ncbi:hypothetical protein VW35_05830 [Devosia soli]|uniref:VanZ-like domain-containing protein n=1 Tax=Devosia soli TaxID=361041 RepID=A0A0F5LC61_9HYPH|nr:hypothetical protein [Devosia soli]KKB79981.1 hypothetical protein VW35_05830 [Devosia soli]
MWHFAKMLIKDMTGLTDPVLHLIVGTVVYLGLALALRRPIVALAIVVSLQLTNETVDLVENLNGAGFGGALEDTALTLVPALVLSLLFCELQRAFPKTA